MDKSSFARGSLLLQCRTTRLYCVMYGMATSRTISSSNPRSKKRRGDTYARSDLSTNATPERCGVREPNIAFRIPAAARCVCSKRMDGWMDGWIDGWMGALLTRGVTTHCVNNDRVSCPLSSSWFSRLSPTRVDLGNRKGALWSRENRSDFRERQRAGERRQ